MSNDENSSLDVWKEEEGKKKRRKRDFDVGSSSFEELSLRVHLATFF